MEINTSQPTRYDSRLSQHGRSRSSSSGRGGDSQRAGPVFPVKDGVRPSRRDRMASSSSSTTVVTPLPSTKHYSCEWSGAYKRTSRHPLEFYHLRDAPYEVFRGERNYSAQRPGLVKNIRLIREELGDEFKVERGVQASVGEESSPHCDGLGDSPPDWGNLKVTALFMGETTIRSAKFGEKILPLGYRDAKEHSHELRSGHGGLPSTQIQRMLSDMAPRHFRDMGVGGEIIPEATAPITVPPVIEAAAPTPPPTPSQPLEHPSWPAAPRRRIAMAAPRSQETAVPSRGILRRALSSPSLVIPRKKGRQPPAPAPTTSKSVSFTLPERPLSPSILPPAPTSLCNVSPIASPDHSPSLSSTPKCKRKSKYSFRELFGDASSPLPEFPELENFPSSVDLVSPIQSPTRTTQ